MIRKLLQFILRYRLEDVLAVGTSLGLLALFLTTRLFHTFSLGLHDVAFILLPVGVLGVKALIGLLVNSAREGEENAGPLQVLGSFFRPFLQIVRDWFPFLLLSACYYALFSNLMLKVVSHTADGALARVDGWLLGNQAAILLEPYIRPWLTDTFNVVYFSFVLYLPGMGLWFYLGKSKTAFRRLMMGYLTIILLGVTSYLLVPATGPGIFLADKLTHDLQGNIISRGVDFIISQARVDYDCFPSLHVGIPLLLALYVRDHQRRAFVPALMYVGLMCGATIYLRYHYVIDVVAAFAYAPAAYWLNDFLLAHWPGERIANGALVTEPVPVPLPNPAEVTH